MGAEASVDLEVVLGEDVVAAEVQVVGVVAAVARRRPIEAVGTHNVEVSPAAEARSGEEDRTARCHRIPSPRRTGHESVVRVIGAIAVVVIPIICPRQSLVGAGNERHARRSLPAIGKDNRTLHAVHRTQTEQFLRVRTAVEQISPLFFGQGAPSSRSIVAYLVIYTPIRIRVVVREVVGEVSARVVVRIGLACGPRLIFCRAAVPAACTKSE